MIPQWKPMYFIQCYISIRLWQHQPILVVVSEVFIRHIPCSKRIPATYAITTSICSCLSFSIELKCFLPLGQPAFSSIESVSLGFFLLSFYPYESVLTHEAHVYV